MPGEHQIAAQAAAGLQPGQPRRHRQRFELGVEQGLGRRVARAGAPLRLGPAQAGAEQFDAARFGARGLHARVGVDLELHLQVARAQPRRGRGGAGRGTAALGFDFEIAAAPAAGQQAAARVAGLPLALAAHLHAAAVGFAAEQGVGPGRGAQGAQRIERDGVLGERAFDACLQGVGANAADDQLLGVESQCQRRVGIRAGLHLRLQARGAQGAGLQGGAAQRGGGAEHWPAALCLHLAAELPGQRRVVGPAQCRGHRRGQRDQWLQRGQRGRVEVQAPAVVGGVRCEAALQGGAVRGGAQVGIDGPARASGRAAVEFDQALQRHACEQAVVQAEFGLAAQREHARFGSHGRGHRGAGLQFGLPAAGQAVRALAPSAACRSGEPQRGVEAGELTAAAQLPCAGCIALGSGVGQCACVAALGLQIAQVDAPGAGAAFGVGLGCDLYRQRAARVQAAVERQARLQALAGRRGELAIGRGQAAELQRAVAAQRHGRCARVEQRRTHALQAQHELGRSAVPFAAAVDAAGAGRELQCQALHRDARTITRLAGQDKVEGGNRQALLVPAAGRSVGEGDAHGDRCVESAGVDLGAARQLGHRQAAAQAGEVEILRVGGEGGQRPGGERLYARIGTQRGAGCLLTAELGLQGQRGQRAARCGACLPRPTAALE